jgi:hypothetical protein
MTALQYTPINCKDCINLLDVPTNPYPVCDFYRLPNDGLKAIELEVDRKCKHFKKRDAS